MSRLKKEILNKLKEYAGKMGRDHLGGDDIDSPKKGGLRDFDGYDNVDYNRDMPQDESVKEAKVPYNFSKDELKRVLKLLGRNASTEIKMIKAFEKAFGRKLTRDEMFESVNEAKDMTLSDYIKILDKKIEDAQKAVSGKNGSKEEYDNRGDILQNFRLFRNYLSAMDKRHKGNKKKLRFVTENFDNLVEAYVVLYSPKKGVKPVATAAYRDKKDAEKWAKDLGGITMIVKKKVKGVDESLEESMFSAIDQIRQDSKDVRDFVKNVFKDREFKKMSNDKDFIKYLKSIYEGTTNEDGHPQNWMSGRTSDYHTALRGKNKDYSGGTNFKKKNHGQPDIEDDDEDQETNHLSNKQLHVKAKLKVAESGKKKSDKNYKDWKSTNEGFDKIEHLQLLNKALRAIPGSPKQKDIIRKLNKVRKAGGMRPLKEQSIVEYASKLTLSYIADKDSKLDGTPEDIKAIDEKAKRDYKDEYKKFQSSKKSKKYRAELNKYNRQKGTYGNGDGKDASHKGGKIVGFESASKNRGRAEKSRLKKK